MAKDNASTPNERLLAMIRRGAEKVNAAASPQEPLLKRTGLFSFAKAVSIGVDISQTQLTCIRIRGRDAGFEVLGAAVVSLREGTEPGSDAFVQVLRRTLAELCGPGPVPEIWAAVQSSRVDLQYVTIPKVASGKVDNAVFWTAKKEMGFEESAVVFDYERRGEITEKGMTRIGAMAYTVPREAVDTVKSDFAKAGFPLAGLTLEPFAHQNFFRRHIGAESQGATANLHVGQNWSRLEIFHDGNLMFVRVIKTSMSGMEQAVREALEANLASIPQPVPETGMSIAPGAAVEPLYNLDDHGDEGPGLVLELESEPPAPSLPASSPPLPPPGESRPRVTLEQARELLWSIVYGCEHIDSCHPGEGLGPEDVMGMLEPVASRLVRQVEMTLKHYRESLGYEDVRRLTVSGPLGGSKLFVAFIGEQTGLPCVPLDPLGPRAPKVPLSGGMAQPGPAWTQALGLAFSDLSVTPSALYTYLQKTSVRVSRLLEQWTLIILAAVLAAMAFFSFDAASTRRALTRDRDKLNQELHALGGSTDMAGLSRQTAELHAKREVLRAYAVRNSVVGMWAQALALAPDGVGLGTLTTEFGPPEAVHPQKQNDKKAKETAAPVRLVIDGMITGDQRLYDSMLASYVVALEGSPLFENVSVKKNEMEVLADGTSGLRYVIGIELARGERP
jgi:Tfp pilus assembly PilM family ATPase